MNYNASDPAVQTLTAAVANDPKVRAEFWNLAIHTSANQNDDLSPFEGKMKDMNKGKGSVRGIICVKDDLTKEGGDTVNFTTATAPAGPGVIGEQVMTGNESRSEYNTFNCRIDYHRDAVSYTKKQLKGMGVGKDIMPLAKQQLGMKMGLWRQNELLLRFRNDGVGNTYRPNMRTSRSAITAADLLLPSSTIEARALAERNGAKPINISKGRYGSVTNQFLCFGTTDALQSIRNDSGYQNAITSAGARGEKNPAFAGDLVYWQNQAFFEHHLTNMDWDDWIGSPLEPLARIKVAVGRQSAPADLKLKASADNTKSRYFQWFPGFDYPYLEVQQPTVDNSLHYAWVLNPNGSYVFVEYIGSGNDGNSITINKILSPEGEGTSGKGSEVVGNINATGDSWGNGVVNVGGGGTGNTSPNHTYSDEIQSGAHAIYANANGVPIGWTLEFGCNAAYRAYGHAEHSMIRDEFDYGFVKGCGYMGVWGSVLHQRFDKITNGYVLIEHAVKQAGFNPPAL